jgi:hypothetical protein
MVMMAKMNVWKRMFPVRTHEGAVAQRVGAKAELRRTVLTCLLWEDTFYEKGSDIAGRIAAQFCAATFSNACVEIPARRGFALRDGIVGSQQHGGTYLKRALERLRGQSDWQKLDRVIVITDEQAHDGILPAWTPKAYVVNVAPYKHGVSYGNGWTHVDSWSERVIDYIAAVESERAA